ncbi:2-dehydropantoate 2-reductase [Peribacillus sp. NPDC097675]|uniref:2-dehydropantoate 2-reductase n=1 Tax=Peribacillus sp. NPDC097675 TaxID=3390618 RepID=UPI003D07D16C
MKIGVIGGGSIGLLFASYLCERHEVTLYTRREEQASLINREGVRLIVDGAICKRDLPSKVLKEGLREEELLLVTVKQYHLPQILPVIEGLQVPMLFLQNGYGHISHLKQLKSSTICVGVVEHGALRLNENTVEHTGIGLTRVASYKGDLNRLPFLDEGENLFPFIESEDYHSMLIDKLIVNAVINPLTALLEVENGRLITNPFYYQLFQALFAEISSVLELPDAEESFRHVKSVCANTSENRSSMLKDIELGRETEIDAILGYIMAEAVRKEKKACMASSLYVMIKGKEFQGG